jgi:hypothetical protein
VGQGIVDSDATRGRFDRRCPRPRSVQDGENNWRDHETLFRLRNLKDERLGEIADIVLSPEKKDIIYVTISHGAFLGFGEKLGAIPWTDLRATDDHELYVLDVAPKAFDDAPTVDSRNFAKTAESEWQHALAQYWDGVLGK